MTIRTRRKEDPDAFSKNQHKVLYTNKDGSYMSADLLSGRKTFHRAKKR